MFKNKQFYNQHIRKAIIAFGMLFNNISIDRKDDAGNVVQTIRVPLSYSPKNKMLYRLETDVPDTRGEVAITLPRMGFEITTLRYDPSRKISLVQKHRRTTDDSTVKSTFTATPYNMGISLYLIAKNQEDALQVIEQVLPFFNPDFNVTINDLPELGIKRDLKFILENIDYRDDYEGDLAARRTIIWTLDFVVAMNLYGDVSNQGIIKQAIVNTYTDPNLITRLSQTRSFVGTVRATARPVVDAADGTVRSIYITYPGAEYKTAPAVTIEGNATAVAYIDGEGRISDIEMTDVGSGYDPANPPTVTIDPPNIPNYSEDPYPPEDAFRYVDEFDETYGQ